jgi:hypothetical protein
LKRLDEYKDLSRTDLYSELVEVSRVLMFEHTELGSLSGDQHVEYLKSFATSGGNSVSGRERDAQFQTKELTQEIIQSRARINALTVQRDLLVFILLNQSPTPLLEYPPARMDAEGLSA